MNIYDQTINNRMRIIIISEDRDYITHVKKLFEDNPVVTVKEIAKTIDGIGFMDEDDIYTLFVIKLNPPKEKEEIQDYLDMHEGIYSGILLYQNKNKEMVNRFNRKTSNFLESYFFYFKEKKVIEMLRPKM